MWLEGLIRGAGTDDPTPAGRRRVVFDTVAKTVVQRAPFLINRERFRCFHVVAPDNPASARVGVGPIEIQSFAGQWSLRLHLTCEVRLAEGGLPALLSAMCADADPEKAMEARIADSVLRFARGQETALASRYQEAVASLRTAVAADLVKSVGLAVEVRVEVVGDEPPSRLPFNRTLRVVLKDRVPARLDVLLVCEARPTDIRRKLRHERSLAGDLWGATVQHLHRTVTSADLYGAGAGGLGARLREALEGTAAQFGYDVVSARIEPRGMALLSSELDPIIRELDAPLDDPGAGHVQVYLDAVRDEVVRSISSERMDAYRYFLVGTTENPSSRALVTLPPFRLPVGDEGATLPVRLVCEIKPAPEGAERLVRTLRGGQLRQRLGERLELWVRQVLQGRESDLLVKLKRLAADAQERISKGAIEEFGLQIAANLTLGEQELRLLVVPTRRMDVRLRDRDVRSPIDIEFDLDVVRDEEALCHLDGPRRTLPDALLPTIERYFATSVSYQEFHSRLGTAVRDGLRAALDEDARRLRFGRRVGRLRLSTPERAPVDLRLQRQRWEVDCGLRGHASPVRVVADVQFGIDDLARWERAGQPNVPAAVEAIVREVTQNIVWPLSYVDLCTRFEPQEQRIREVVIERTGVLGCRIDQFTTVPEHRFRELAAGWVSEVGTGEEVYLKDRDVRVGMVVYTRLQIPSPRLIEGLLNRNDDVRKHVDECIVGALREFMLTVSPEDYYVRFRDPAQREEQQARGVESALRDVIVSRLGERFGAEVEYVTINRGRTAVMEAVDAIRKGPFPFTVIGEPFDGEEEVNFFGRVEFPGFTDAAGFRRFLGRLPTPEQLLAHVQDTLKPLLDAQPLDVLRFMDDQARQELREAVEQPVLQDVGQTWGLTMRISAFNRKKTRSEAEASAARAVIEARKTNLLLLESAHQEAVVQGAIQSAAADVRRREELGERRHAAGLRDADDGEGAPVTPVDVAAALKAAREALAAGAHPASRREQKRLTPQIAADPRARPAPSPEPSPREGKDDPNGGKG